MQWKIKGISSKIKILKMKSIFSIFILLIILSRPLGINAEEAYALQNEPESKELSKEINPPINMSRKEIDNLLGPDPYLGPTSWIESKEDK